MEILLIDWEKAKRRHYNTSHVPEKRADGEVARFKHTMEEMQKEIQAIPNIGENWTKEFEIFNARSVSLYQDYLYSKSRTASTMITGGANFPARRNQKLMGYTHNKLQAYSDWINNTVKKLAKKYKIKYTFDEQVELKAIELESLKTRQEMMKSANKIIRSKKLSEIEKVDEMVNAGFTEERAMELMQPNRYQGMGYARFELTNNNAKIKAAEKRLVELQNKATAETKTVFKSEELGLEIKEDAELDRIMFYFDGKPEQRIINIMKSSAFKWSRKNGAWQRKTTNNARWVTNKIIKELQELQ